MELSYETIKKVLDRCWPRGDYQSADNYGEPGYSFRHGTTTPMVVLTDYWCQCGKVLKDDGSAELHTYEYHWPKVWAQMESQGVEFQWSDEWTIDYDHSKAYRTKADSYSWQPTAILNTDTCEYLTPDDDIETWIEWASNDDTRCIPRRVWSSGDLIEAGFREYGSRYESGWHEDQTDDPTKITAEIRKWEGPDVEVVFLLDEASQFYIGFSAWIRGQEDEED